MKSNSFRNGIAGRGLDYQLPLLECAKLSGADLSGLALVLFVKGYDTTSSSGITYSIKSPRMLSVQLDDSTRLDAFSVITSVSITDDYLKKHAAAPEVRPLTTTRTDAGWENPLAGGQWGAPEFRRLHGTFAADASKYTHTMALADWQFDADELKLLGNDAFMLRGYIDQPTLKALPLYSKFVDAVTALKAPESHSAKSAKAWSDRAAGAWTKMERLSCDKSPPPDALLFDLGEHASDYGPD